MGLIKKSFLSHNLFNWSIIRKINGVIVLKEEKKAKIPYKDMIKNIGIDKLLIIAICGVVLVMFSIPTGKSKKTNSKSSVSSTNQTISITNDDYTKKLESKLEDLLSRVKGVGNVKVMITLKDQGEKVILKEMPCDKSEQHDKDSNGGTSDQTQISQKEVVIYQKNTNGEQVPYVIKENLPVIDGIAVIAQGGDNAETAVKITNIAQALFGISSHKISVIGMRK